MSMSLVTRPVVKLVMGSACAAFGLSGSCTELLQHAEQNRRPHALQCLRSIVESSFWHELAMQILDALSGRNTRDRRLGSSKSTLSSGGVGSKPSPSSSSSSNKPAVLKEPPRPDSRHSLRRAGGGVWLSRSMRSSLRFSTMERLRSESEPDSSAPICWHSLSIRSSSAGVKSLATPSLLRASAGESAALRWPSTWCWTASSSEGTSKMWAAIAMLMSRLSSPAIDFSSSVVKCSWATGSSCSAMCSMNFTSTATISDVRAGSAGTTRDFHPRRTSAFFSQAALKRPERPTAPLLTCAAWPEPTVNFTCSSWDISLRPSSSTRWKSSSMPSPSASGSAFAAGRAGASAGAASGFGAPGEAAAEAVPSFTCVVSSCALAGTSSGAGHSVAAGATLNPPRSSQASSASVSVCMAPWTAKETA
mmetsp:Transcript_1349/g.4857  ORF Transcript_1349/g.4857 Transcript_1349/m.4857 type:complete len:420 (-) Transcript_1349:71-1330(-)